jgi:hypothetical protein
MSVKPKVALSQDFLGNMAKLPSGVQGKILKWAIRFQSDPTSSGINYEKIKTARDQNLRSVRIDQDWRGIVFKPPQGDVYVLLYADHHDSAYRWAENRKLAINPVTGAMQIVVLEEVAQPQVRTYEKREAAVAAEEVHPPLFENLSERELMSLGTPEELVLKVRSIRSEDDLDALQSALPVEAYEGLFLVAAGETVSNVLASRETRIDKEVDTSNFAGALETAESQARFYVVEDDEALTAVLNAPLAQWRVFLHPTQRKLAVGDRSGPVRVLGGAGTGKTVLAMHRAKWLAENRTNDDQKVLFTTFTRNLAIDIEENLKTLCTAQTMRRIEVKNLDAWVYGFLRSQHYEHRIVYGRQGEAAEAWQRALAVKDAKLGFSDEFYVQELEQVVLAYGVATRDEYRTVRRAGRGVILSRSKRDAIWPVFEEYRAQLTSRKLKEVDDAYRDAAALLAKLAKPAFSAIVVDETQDLGPQALRLLRAMIPHGSNDLFFVGDGHQRIYNRNRAAMSRCGIEIRGRSRKLYLNYRTTEEIRRQAVALLEGCEIDDLDDGRDENRLYKSLSRGPVPKIMRAGDLESALAHLEELIAVHKESSDQSAMGSLCIIAQSRAVRDLAAQRIASKGMEVNVIEADSKDSGDGNAIRVSTMHRAKGLEFDHVVVITSASVMGKPEDTLDDRRLLYVSLTRAKRSASIVLV